MSETPKGHRDLGQRQAEDLNEADWNKREGSQADPNAETEAERRAVAGVGPRPKGQRALAGHQRSAWPAKSGGE